MVRVSPAMSARRPKPRQNPNALLAALPADDYRRVQRTLTTMPVSVRQILQEPNAPIDQVYFPASGFVSILTLLRDGRMIEVATIGREGVAGATAAFDTLMTPTTTMVQGKMDACFAMPVAAFRKEMDRGGSFHDLTQRYTGAFIGVAMQSTACNAVHTIEQRLARWLLTAAGHMDSDVFELTQEFVAMMLGASRQTVSVATGALQRRGSLRYQRGRVTIVDRQALARESCECYRAVVGLLERAASTRG